LGYTTFSPIWKVMRESFDEGDVRSSRDVSEKKS